MNLIFDCFDVRNSISFKPKLLLNAKRKSVQFVFAKCRGTRENKLKVVFSYTRQEITKFSGMMTKISI